MDNKCPKCGYKLSVFYLKDECPNCGTSIMYYNMENRLEEDAKKAEEEYAKLDALIEKITPKFVKRMKEKKNNTQE